MSITWKITTQVIIPVMIPKKQFKATWNGGHSMLMINSVLRLTSHVITEMININFFIV
jgi:hypothetical protein